MEQIQSLIKKRAKLKELLLFLTCETMKDAKHKENILSSIERTTINTNITQTIRHNLEGGHVTRTETGQRKRLYVAHLEQP